MRSASGSFLARNIFSNLNHPYYNGFSGKEVLMKFFSSTHYTPQQLQNIAIDLFCDVLGSILSAIGIYTFAKLASFAPGGISGVALILNHLWNLPIGTTSLVINIPLILLSYRIVGRKFMIKSIRTILINTFFLDFVFPLTPAYDGNPMLAALFSGVFFGWRSCADLHERLVYRRYGLPYYVHQSAAPAPFYRRCHDGNRPRHHPDWLAGLW